MRKGIQTRRETEEKKLEAENEKISQEVLVSNKNFVEIYTRLKKSTSKTGETDCVDVKKKRQETHMDYLERENKRLKALRMEAMENVTLIQKEAVEAELMAKDEDDDEDKMDDEKEEDDDDDDDDDGDDGDYEDEEEDKSPVDVIKSPTPRRTRTPRAPVA